MLVSAAIILLGVALFVVQEGVPAILFAPRGAPASWNADPQSLGVVLAGLAPARPAAVTDLGLLLLMITPVVSVGSRSPRSRRGGTGCMSRSRASSSRC